MKSDEEIIESQGFIEPEPQQLKFSFPPRPRAELSVCQWCRNYRKENPCPQLMKSTICCSFEGRDWEVPELK